MISNTIKETYQFLGGKLKDAFYKTTEDRQNNVIESAIEEFSKHSFREASLNDIIKSAKISKGGMFKYIDDKAELYLYVVELVMQEMIDYQMAYISDNPCYIKRTFDMMINSRNFYIDNPIHYKLMIKISLDVSSPCYDQLIMIRHNVIKKQRELLEKDIDWSLYKKPRSSVENYLSTVLTGINVQLLQLMSGEGFYDFSAFISDLKGIRDITRKGLYLEC